MDLLTASWKDLKRGVERGEIGACVVGLGYVGLPLATILAEIGFKVRGVDKRQEVVAKCQEGGTHLYEKGLKERLLKAIKKGKISFSTDVAAAVRSCQVIFITVGTPLTAEKKVDTTGLAEAAKAVAKGLGKGKLVILKSTVPIGGTRQIVKPVLESVSGLVAERDFGLAFVPERIVEGNSLYEMVNLPKIVSGLGLKSRRAAQGIYRLIGGAIITVSCLEVAEAAKVFDNIYRDVNIALSNEMAIACEWAGADVVEAINVANWKYSRTHILTPGVGVGGSCLTKDSYILAEAFTGAGENNSLILKARQINDAMPQHFVDLVKDAFGEMNKKLAGSRVAVLGYAMKSGTSDTRETPVRPVIEKLKKEKAIISIYDPFVPAAVIQNEVGISSAVSLVAAIQAADAVCIVTDHEEFFSLDLSQLKGKCHRPCAIIDGRHLIEPRKALALGFVFRGVGRPQRCFKTE